MNKYQVLKDLIPIIYPKFYCRTDLNGNELVLLDIGQNDKSIPLLVSDRTQFEAIENHFHLFGKVRLENIADCKEICIQIAQNLAKSLRQSFPTKSFAIFLTINRKDSIIIRFHQIWPNEPPYFDTKKFDFGDTEIIEFLV